MFQPAGTRTILRPSARTEANHDLGLSDQRGFAFVCTGSCSPSAILAMMISEPGRIERRQINPIQRFVKVKGIRNPDSIKQRLADLREVGRARVRQRESCWRPQSNDRGGWVLRSRLTIRIPMRLQRRGVGKLIMAPEGMAMPMPKPRRDETLIKVLVKAHRWRRRIESGQAKSITDLAEQEVVTDAYVCWLLPLTCLAPAIVKAILDGRQPRELKLGQSWETGRWCGRSSGRSGCFFGRLVA
jgi:hypothetical protein